jgi:predicted MPP superfamily phosphohydrolase
MTQRFGFTRRRFLILTGLGAASVAGVGLYTCKVEPHWIDVVERDMAIAGLPKSLAGAKVVQISDLHVGPEVDSQYLINALERVSALAPDLTLITGDFMTCHDGERIDEAVQVVSHLKHGKFGCYAVPGNHDYAAHWRQVGVLQRLAAKLRNLDIRVLRNEVVDVSGLQLVGIDDYWATNFKPEDVVPKVEWHRPALTLCHNPDGVDQPAMKDVRGWILSGHTHGGQCKPPFLPPPLLPVKNKRYTSGAFDLNDGRHLYINRGLGHLMQVRFNARPEITVFRLRQA